MYNFNKVIRRSLVFIKNIINYIQIKFILKVLIVL